MARAGVTPQRIIDEAAHLADERGLDQITLAELASRLGVRVPSLYKHLSGLTEVNELLADQCRLELATAMERATIGRAGQSAVESVAHAIRNWAHQHPGRYAATVAAHPSGEEPAGGTQRALQVFLQILDPEEVQQREELIHRARALRSAIHGFIDLELREGFGIPVAIDDSFDWLVTQLAGIVSQGKENPPAGT
jgi:AcrR family transcriptional regulator